MSRDHGAFHCRLAVSDNFGGSVEFATYGYGTEEIGFSSMAWVVDGDTLDIVTMRAHIVSTSLMIVDSDIFTGDHLHITLTR